MNTSSYSAESILRSCPANRRKSRTDSHAKLSCFQTAPASAGNASSIISYFSGKYNSFSLFLFIFEEIKTAHPIFFGCVVISSLLFTNFSYGTCAFQFRTSGVSKEADFSPRSSGNIVPAGITGRIKGLMNAFAVRDETTARR